MKHEMCAATASVRVLYSFPHRIGAARICTTAWHQVEGLAQAGAHVTACPASVARPLSGAVDVLPTLAWSGLRLPYRLVGSRRVFWIHDQIVARRLERLAGSIDIVHAWPLGALRTLETAERLGIPAVLERPNAHTRFAYEVVRSECEKLGVALPAGHEHAFNEQVLKREEAEYHRASRLLCPSDFVARTFVDRGFDATRLARHQYGFDPQTYRPGSTARAQQPGLELLFVGGCAPRKGLHYALDAWLQSPASALGRFRIAGSFVPGYAKRLAPMLSHPSVQILGHREDIADLMRDSDVLVLPSIEEGSALVTAEARGSGCVLLVSSAAGAICTHMHDGLLHEAGDVAALSGQISLLHHDRNLLQCLRARSLAGLDRITWDAAGARLLEIYRETIRAHAGPAELASSAGRRVT